MYVICTLTFAYFCASSVVDPIPNFPEQNPPLYRSLPVSSNGIELLTTLNSLLRVQLKLTNLLKFHFLFSDYTPNIILLSLFENSLSNSLTMMVCKSCVGMSSERVCAGIHTGFFARGGNFVESQKTVYLHNMVKS